MRATTEDQQARKHTPKPSRGGTNRRNILRVYPKADDVGPRAPYPLDEIVVRAALVDAIEHTDLVPVGPKGGSQTSEAQVRAVDADEGPRPDRFDEQDPHLAGSLMTQ
jgi:hypothetical protein